MLISIEKTNLDIINIENANIIKELKDNRKNNLEKNAYKESVPLKTKALEKVSPEDFDKLINNDNDQITVNEYGDHIGWRNLLYSDNSDPRNFNN
jgi:hypothetical protein